MKNISKIDQLKGLKPKNNDHTNFYECCDLTKKVYLIYICTRAKRVPHHGLVALFDGAHSSNIDARRTKKKKGRK